LLLHSSLFPVEACTPCVPNLIVPANLKHELTQASGFCAPCKCNLATVTFSSVEFTNVLCVFVHQLWGIVKLLFFVLLGPGYGTNKNLFGCLCFAFPGLGLFTVCAKPCKSRRVKARLNADLTFLCTGYVILCNYRTLSCGVHQCLVLCASSV
jgi:hypothetical protein